jgi:hypothetical protein
MRRSRGIFTYALVGVLGVMLGSGTLSAAATAAVGGLPELEARVAALETTVASLPASIADSLAAAKLYTDSSVAAEAAARQAADTTLQGNINSEAAARQQGDADTLAAANQYTDSKVASAHGTLQSRRVIGDSFVRLDAFAFGNASASCGAGEVVTGGGYQASGVSVTELAWTGTNSTTWVVRGQGGALGGTLSAVAICSTIGP